MNDNSKNNSPIQFPCDFIVKVMGKASPHFEANVLTLVREHFPNLDTSKVKKNPSKDHNYYAITVTVFAENKAQLDALYRDLSAAPFVLMAL